MVMLDIFAQRSPQRALAKKDDLGQALLLQRPDPALRIGIQVRAARRQHERLDPAGCDDRPEGLGVLGVAIMQQIAVLPQPPRSCGSRGGDSPRWKLIAGGS